MRGEIFKRCHENERFCVFLLFCNTDKRNWGSGKETKNGMYYKTQATFSCVPLHNCTQKKRNEIAFQAQIRNNFLVKINFALY